MPRYFYECDKCKAQFKTVHGMNEVQDHCEICFSDGSSLRRIPQITRTLKPISDAERRVHEAIKENKKILDSLNKEARNQTYDD